MRDIGVEFPSPGKVRFYDLGSPPPVKPTELLIRTCYSGITNGTERHGLMGEHGFGRYPGRHGYQHVGRVEAKGDQVQGFELGDWVYYGRYVGHRGWHIQDVSQVDPSAYTSHLVLPLPDDVDYRQCALFGVAGVAMRGVRRFRIAPGQNVWVAGAGLIGSFAAQAARAVGARVTSTEVEDKRLSIAREVSSQGVGPNRVLDAREEASMEALGAAGPYDCIIDACGVESLFLDIHERGLLAYKGVIGALAVRTETVFHWSMLHGREASIEVSCHYSLDDLGIVLYFLQEGRMQIEPLITHSVPIDQAPAIYALLRDRPHDLLGVVLDWTA